jgi:hypothetical protein
MPCVMAFLAFVAVLGHAQRAGIAQNSTEISSPKICSG